MRELKLTLPLPDVGAKQPTYLVTADDLDSLLAIEVQPLDDRKSFQGLRRPRGWP